MSATGIEEKENPAEDHRVVLLAPAEGRVIQDLARALAGRGHSLILWDWRPEPDAAAAQLALLDLQIELERAGGISLVQAGPDLTAAAEAFGRIDVALALGREAAGQVAAAATGLERRLRPARLIVLAGGPPVGEMLSPAPPQGMRMIVMDFPESGAAPAEAIARVVAAV